MTQAEVGRRHRPGAHEKRLAVFVPVEDQVLWRLPRADRQRSPEQRVGRDVVPPIVGTPQRVGARPFIGGKQAGKRAVLRRVDGPCVAVVRVDVPFLPGAVCAA